MKAMHRLMVTSQTYRLASAAPPASANLKIDPANTALWHFRLQRLDAEAIWDAIYMAAGNLDVAVGGPSFDIGAGGGGKRARGPWTAAAHAAIGGPPT